MELYLQRHGIAAQGASHGGDAQRPLTHAGRRQMATIATAIRNMELGLEAIVSSPYRRARETAELVAEELGLHESLHVADGLKCGATPEEMVKAIREHAGGAKRILAVGHQPGLGHLVSLLTTSDLRLTINFQTGSLAKLSLGGLRARDAELEWLLTPAQLEAMA